MALNGSRRTSGPDPWRSGPDEGPPDLIRLIKNFLNKFKNKSNQSGTPQIFKDTSRIVGIVVVILLALWALSGVFLVSPAEQSVILRFGKYIRTLGPGPHWIPTLFERRFTANIQRIDSFPYESEMLTQDGNIVSVKVQVQYRIVHLKDYLFNVVSPLTTLHQAVSSSVRQIVGQMDLDPMLTTGREELSERVTVLLNDTLQNYHSGLEVREVTLQSVKPPEAVTMAFDDVIKAREDEKRYINQAQAYAKKRVLTAEGQIARIEQEASAYRYSVVAQATGATARYLALLKPYQSAPGITRERLYLDSLSQILSNTKNIVVDSSSSNVLYLPVDQFLGQPKSATPSPAAPTTNTNNVAGGSENLGNTSLDMNSLENTTQTERPSYPTEGENP